jgi:hypothetical protein
MMNQNFSFSVGYWQAICYYIFMILTGPPQSVFLLLFWGNRVT